MLMQSTHPPPPLSLSLSLSLSLPLSLRVCVTDVCVTAALSRTVYLEHVGSTCPNARLGQRRRFTTTRSTAKCGLTIRRRCYHTGPSIHTRICVGSADLLSLSIWIYLLSSKRTRWRASFIIIYPCCFYCTSVIVPSCCVCLCLFPLFLFLSSLPLAISLPP